MVTLFEFLGKEEIENVVTCLNYRIDKVVYFGYQEEIDRQRSTLESFLRKYCKVQEVSFVPLSHKNLPAIIKVMSSEISTEKANGSELYFDVTGGESLILVAFGTLSSKYETPMHFYDIEKNKMFEIDEGVDKSISDSVETNNVKLNVDMWVEMKGGAVNYFMQKGYKEIEDPDFIDDIESLWSLMQEYPKLWNPFSEFIRNYMIPKNGLGISMESNDINRCLQISKTKLNTVKRLKSLLEKLNEAGIIQNYDYSAGMCRFNYKNKGLLSCLTDGGSVLELHVYLQEKIISDDCRIGVHLDWDGVIHQDRGVDVLNEIDVLTLRGNIPTFISCKSGKMNANQILHALYELDTVAERFGGKYARKMLATIQSVPEVYINRANEMNIVMY
jgi:hypothetical protein